MIYEQWKKEGLKISPYFQVLYNNLRMRLMQVTNQSSNAIEICRNVIPKNKNP